MHSNYSFLEDDVSNDTYNRTRDYFVVMRGKAHQRSQSASHLEAREDVLVSQRN